MRRALILAGYAGKSQTQRRFHRPTAVVRDVSHSTKPRVRDLSLALIQTHVTAQIDIKDHAVLAGAAGGGFATEFVAFLQMYTQLPNLDAILMNPDNSPVPDKPAALYAVITGLARKGSPANAERLFRYLRVHGVG